MNVYYLITATACNGRMRKTVGIVASSADEAVMRATLSLMPRTSLARIVGSPDWTVEEVEPVDVID